MIKGMSKKQTGSQTSLRELNRANILDTLHKFGAMTQIELAETTGLSTATVSTLIHELADAGKIDKRNTVRNGRRATLVTLAHNQGLGIGISIGRRRLELQILDFSSQSLASHELPLAAGHRPDETLERAQMLLVETLDTIGADISEVVGIGVAVSAPIERKHETVGIPGILPHWEGVDIKGEFERAYHLPIVVDNDANTAALCEARLGAGQGIDSFLYVQADDNVGAGLITRGEIRRGVTGFAGEIGHIQVDPLGSICTCGNRGCLNTLVNEDHLTSLLEITHGKLTLNDMIRLANQGDAGCRRIVQDAATRIGDTAAAACITIDPEIVVLGGRFALAEDIFLEPFSEALQRKLFPNVMAAIDVHPAQYPTSNAAMGAAIMAIETVGRSDMAAR